MFKNYLRFALLLLTAALLLFACGSEEGETPGGQADDDEGTVQQVTEKPTGEGQDPGDSLIDTLKEAGDDPDPGDSLIDTLKKAGVKATEEAEKKAEEAVEEAEEKVGGGE
jgi:hypothetical protein